MVVEILDELVETLTTKRDMDAGPAAEGGLTK